MALRERIPNAFLVGILLTILGAGILIGPLLYVMWVDPTGEESGVLFIGLPLFLFISALFLAFGLTVLFSQVVDYKAVGAGRVKLLGLEMPMEFQGAAMVLFLLLLGIGASVKLFDLMSINENWSEWKNMRDEIVKHEATINSHEKTLAKLTSDHQSQLSNLNSTHFEEKSVLSSRVSKLEGRLETTNISVSNLKEVLIAQSRAKGNRLLIRFKCSRYENPRYINWTGNSNDRIGNLLATGARHRHENSTDLPSKTLNPFTLKAGNETTYTIMTVDALSRQPTPVISTSFYFEDENLVAEIWPNTMSLYELCKKQNSPRSSSMVNLDGQQGFADAPSWQEELEAEPEW